MDQHEQHLHQRIEITDGQRISVDSDRPLTIEFFDDDAYARFPGSQWWNSDCVLAEFPSTIDAPGPGFWNVVIRHAPGSSPQATVAVAPA